MGGCRCVFRKCKNNSSNSPAMHFFHFPVKDAQRLETWVKMAKADFVMELTPKQAKNKVVCETHFRDECFMNYKKDRLTALAYPTLIRLGRKIVLDYEKDLENPEPSYLPRSRLPHLIAPGEVISDSEEESEAVTLVMEKMSTEPSRLKLTPIKAPKRKSDQPDQKILNKKAKGSDDLGQRQTVRIVTENLPKLPEADLELQSQLEVMEDLGDDSNSIYDVITVSNLDEERVEIERIQECEKESKIVEFNKVRAEFQVLEADYERLIEQLNQKLEKQSAESAELAERARKAAAEAEQAKQKAKEAEEAAAIATSALTQVETVSTSKIKSASTAQSNPLTKAQLFNSIKKYLSPSMATLVRMEMFGGPEREWKPDEKQVAVDLMRLGENVFNFLRDEWRFRMPSKKDVLQWMAENDVLEEDEDL